MPDTIRKVEYFTIYVSGKARSPAARNTRKKGRSAH